MAAKKAPAKKPAKRASTKGPVKYDAKELELQALEEITKRKLVFIDEVVSYLPCCRTTFHDLGLNKTDTIKAALNKNKVDLKAGMRKKWYESDNATKQLALYKLIGTDEEAHRLNGSRTEQTVTVQDPEALRQLFGLDE